MHNIIVSKKRLEETLSHLKNEKIKIPEHKKELTVVWDNRELPEQGDLNNYLFICRVGHSFDSYKLIPSLSERNCLILGEENRAHPYQEYLKNNNFIGVENIPHFLKTFIPSLIDIKSYKHHKIAITGTSGKTSITYFTSYLLKQMRSSKITQIGTLGISIHTNTYEGLYPTMPDFPSFMKILNESKKEGCSEIIFEATSHGLTEERMGDEQVDIAVWSNLSQDHLDYHKTMENYKEAKSFLFTKHLKKEGWACLNFNDKEFPFFFEKALSKTKNIALSGYNHDNFLNLVAHNKNLNYMFLEINKTQSNYQGSKVEVTLWSNRKKIQCAEIILPLIGTFQVENITLTIITLLCKGIPLDDILKEIPDIPQIPGRLEKIERLPSAPTVLVDYAHKPDALEKAIQSLLPLCQEGELWTVFGCGGDRDRSKRSVMGRIASTLSHYTVVTSDNPRTEKPLRIIHDICQGIEKTKRLTIIEDREEAIRSTIQRAKPKDIILIAGKGHEEYQIIGNKKNPFSDLAIAKSELLRMDSKALHASYEGYDPTKGTPPLKTKIFIAGAARSGIALAKLLKNKGYYTFLTEYGKLDDPTIQDLQTHQIPFEHKGHTLEKIKDECDILVISPGIPLTSRVTEYAASHNIPILSEIEVASWFTHDYQKTIAITGTNGKSTATAYTEQLIKLINPNCKACGNFGYPYSKAVKDQSEYLITELSSYQLETTHTLKPVVSIILNVQEDHQTRYGNMKEYLKSKWRLALMTHPEGTLILDKKVFLLAIKEGLSIPSVKTIYILDEEGINYKKQTHHYYNKQLPVPSYGNLCENNNFPVDLIRTYIKSIEDGYSIYLGKTEEPLLINTPCLPGIHNQTNILAASLASYSVGVPCSLIKKQWEQKTTKYCHIPHRLEKVTQGHNKQGIPYTTINDSKATNLESVLVAIQSFKTPILLLLGGEPKGEDFSLILNKKHTVKSIIPFGKAGIEIYKQLTENIQDKKEIEIKSPVKSLKEAILLAYQELKEESIILLSPGCASFDEFKDFEERGEMFKKWVNEL